MKYPEWLPTLRILVVVCNFLSLISTHCFGADGFPTSAGDPPILNTLPSLSLMYSTTSAFTSAYTNGTSYLKVSSPSLMALTGAGPQQKMPGRRRQQNWGTSSLTLLLHLYQASIGSPSLLCWGVESLACQPSYPSARSGRVIQFSTQTWKFLRQNKVCFSHLHTLLIKVSMFLQQCYKKPFGSTKNLSTNSS